MEKYDAVVLLGSQIQYVDDQDRLAPHTKLKADAAAIALIEGFCNKLIISGGYNYGVRYDDKAVFNTQHPTQKKPDFTFGAFCLARYTSESEANAIQNYLNLEYGISPDVMLLEELSATTEENAEFVRVLLRRTPTFDGVKKIGLLTLLYHMERALPIFKKAGVEAEPLFAENLLALGGKEEGIDEICTYYATPKGGKQYDVTQIRQLLTEGESLAKMMN